MSQHSPAPGALSLQLGPEFAQTIAAALADELERRGTLAPQATSPYLTVPEAAEYMRCAPQAVYDRISQGVLEPRRDGRRVLLDRRTLDAYLTGGAS
jgi:excisionase family DNA binding protein